MKKKVITWLIRSKGLDPDLDYSDWRWPELFFLGCELANRILRGCWLKIRVGSAPGLVLCQPRVVIKHGRHIRAGSGFSVQEGAEIVGLSRRGVTFGNKCTVGRFATIRPTNVLFREPGEGMKVGDGSNIGPYAFIGCSGWIEIGANVMMGPRVTLLAENHNFESIERPMKEQGVTRSFIRIEDDVWLGAGCSITAGVTIGRGSIVAAGAVVTRDVEPYSVVGGMPAKLIRKRE